MAYRTEMTIPVNKDPRTFEQRRDDLVNKLERSYSRRETSSSTVSSVDTSSSVKDNKVGMFHNSVWDGEISDWVHKTRLGWDQEMSGLRNRMFSLEPSEGGLSVDDWDPFKSMGDGQSRTSSSHSTTSSRTITSSKINGKETNSEITSSSSTSTTGKGPQTQADFPAMGSLFDRSSKPRSQLLERKDFLKDAYEVGEDGQVHFKVRFDAKDFKPENILVSTQDNRLSVSAKQTTKTDNTTSTKEFSRSIDLPSSIEHEKFTCQMTEDGVLILDAPVKAPEYQQITFKDGLGIRPVSGEKTSIGQEIVKITGQTGPIVVPNGTAGKKIHVEVPVDAAFAPEDFTVKTETNKIHISGRHEVKTANSSSFKEFSRYYEVPETLDPMSVTANLIEGTLVVEAPLAER